MRLRTFVVAAAAAAAALVVGSAAARPASPQSVYRAAVAAASAHRSVHYVSTSDLAGNREVLVGDAGSDRGIQRIAFTKGGTTGHVTVVVVANAAYVRGDLFTLENYLGLTAAQGARYGGRWFVIRPPNAAFGPVAEAVRMQSFVAELLMPQPLVAAPPAKLAGSRVTGVRSRVTRSGKTVVLDLYVRAGSPLPVAQIARGSAGTITTTMSRWNERVAVVAPHGTLPFR